MANSPYQGGAPRRKGSSTAGYTTRGQSSRSTTSTYSNVPPRRASSSSYRSSGTAYARTQTRSAPRKAASKGLGFSSGSGRSGRGRRKKSGGNKTLLLAVLILIVGIIGVGVFAGIRSVKAKRLEEQLALERQQREELLSRDTFYDGITVEGVPLSGLTMNEAMQALRRHAAVSTDLTIELTDGEQSVFLPVVEGNDLDKVLDQAYAIGRTGSEEERLKAIEDLTETPVSFDVKQGYSVLDLDQQIESARETFDIEPINAKVTGFSVSKKTFQIEKEVVGRSINAESVKQKVEKALEGADFTTPVQLEFDELQPSFKASSVGEPQLLARFTTTTNSNANRNTNISLCSEALNGKVVMPGREFSVNDTTGKRSEKKGYLEAKVIRNGVYVEEPGGGVCQVSSTLFNAVVRAGFKVLERHNHTIKSSYVPESEDAAIDYPDKDFRFLNNSDGPVAIVFSFNKEEKQLTARLYGTPILKKGETLDLESKLVSEVPQPEDILREDPTLKYGEKVLVSEGRSGAKYETYLIHLKDGKEVSRELLHKSSYPAKATVYAVNSKAPEMPVVPSEPSDDGGSSTSSEPGSWSLPEEPSIPEE